MWQFVFSLFRLSCFRSYKSRISPKIFNSHSKLITVVAPGAGVSISDLKRLKEALSLEFQFPENLLSEEPKRLFSNSDTIRAKLLCNAILGHSQIIWCLRGGQGSSRLISYLGEMKTTNPKIFIGYSDCTSLHLFFSQTWQWKTIHGCFAMDLIDRNKSSMNADLISDIIARAISKVTLNDLQPLNSCAQLTRCVRGLLTGGNLSIVQSSLGTSWHIDSKGKVLFLEDVNEADYRVDRMLSHLTQANVFVDAVAVVFGEFVPNLSSVMDILQEFARQQNIPVFKSNSFGHGKLNLPLVYNCEAQIYRSTDRFCLVQEFRLNHEGQ
jgi:muramoyltetrapeptide carboxypeptidase